MGTSSARNDFSADLWRTLSPYLGTAQSTIAILYLLVGGAHDAWRPVSALILFQIVVNLLLARQAWRFRNVSVLSYTFGSINWLFCVIILLLAGGYPSLFWLIFILGAIQSGMFIGRTGVLLNTAFAGIAMAAPQLPLLDLQFAVELGISLLLLLAIGLVTEKSTVMLLDEQARYQQAEQQLRQSHQKLSLSLAEQERQTREVALLTEMGDVIQACPSL